MNTTEIVINRIERETEKAICANVSVNWNDGNWHQRNFWFPKSQVEQYTDSEGRIHMIVADWVVRKIERENAFKGYMMQFCVAFYN